MCIKIKSYLSQVVEFHGMAHLQEGFALEGESCSSPCAGGV